MVNTVLRTKLVTLPAWLFTITAVLAFLAVTYLTISLADSALDIPIHDTYFVLGTDHIGIWMGLVFGVFGLCYWLYPKVFNRGLSPILGMLHFGLTVAGLLAFVAPFYLMLSVPQRYYNYTEFEAGTWPPFDLNVWMTAGLLLFFFGQAVFLFNLIRPLFTGGTKAV